MLGSSVSRIAIEAYRFNNLDGNVKGYRDDVLEDDQARAEISDASPVFNEPTTHKKMMTESR